MASEVGICNSALIKLGAATIMSLGDGSRNAALCNEQYGKLRDELLRAHGWNFAIARRKLAGLADVPVYEFVGAFQLPTDWLRTIAVHDNEAGAGAVRYRIEGRTILSDAGELWLRYVRRVTDPNEMTSSFREALAWRMAADLAQTITQSSTIQELMTRGFERATVAARSVDSIEDFPASQPPSDWVTARQ